MSMGEVLRGVSLAMLGAIAGMRWATSQFATTPPQIAPPAVECPFKEGDFVRDRLTGQEGIVERVWPDGEICFRTGRAGGYSFSPAGFERIDALSEDWSDAR